MVVLDYKEYIMMVGVVFDVFKNILFPQVMLGNWFINGEMFVGLYVIIQDVV